MEEVAMVVAMAVLRAAVAEGLSVVAVRVAAVRAAVVWVAA